ncbi:MAG: hypothetical protein K0U24_05270 [Gammaproteobacteria bacterium]|nr:hypothetical protein [Gammaproteobacteria bacterium]MCH9763628.1 hypothetical protein [Gammaproteobacteria bacterium]
MFRRPLHFLFAATPIPGHGLFKEETQTINISDLPKEKVVLALFENVYRKSDVSKKTWASIVSQTQTNRANVPIGTNAPPNDFEIRKMLYRAQTQDSSMSPLHQPGYIDCIGPVVFKMKFSAAKIDAQYYDAVHQTDATAGVLSAKVCIDNLRQKMTLEMQEQSEFNAKIL